MKKKESALFFSYLCAHILQIAFLLLCFAIFAVILYLYDLPADPVLYAALLCAAVGLLSFILSYLRFHKQFRRLESALLNLPESRDDLPEPSGSTAVCYDEAVRMLCTKLAQSETDRRRGQEENTDYFTMWVHQIKTPISAMRLMLGEEDTPRSRALSAELFRIDRYAEMALNYARLNSTSNDLVFAKVEGRTRHKARRAAVCRAVCPQAHRVKVRYCPGAGLNGRKVVGVHFGSAARKRRKIYGKRHRDRHRHKE